MTVEGKVNLLYTREPVVHIILSQTNKQKGQPYKFTRKH